MQKQKQNFSPQAPARSIGEDQSIIEKQNNTE